MTSAPPPPNSSISAFTLAEVLITLGIIGIVAALTMPALIQNYKNKEIETRLQKFYSLMNQAVRLSEAENGPHETWNYPQTPFDTDETLVFYNKYFAKYLKSAKPIVKDGSHKLTVKMPDGTTMQIDNTTANVNLIIYYFPLKQKDIRHNFHFELHKDNKAAVEPLWNDAATATLEWACSSGHPSKESMNAYCTALIQRYGWKIGKDFPVKY